MAALTLPSVRRNCRAAICSRACEGRRTPSSCEPIFWGMSRSVSLTEDSRTRRMPSWLISSRFGGGGKRLTQRLLVEPFDRLTVDQGHRDHHEPQLHQFIV